MMCLRESVWGWKRIKLKPEIWETLTGKDWTQKGKPGNEAEKGQKEIRILHLKQNNNKQTRTNLTKEEVKGSYIENC